MKGDLKTRQKELNLLHERWESASIFTYFLEMADLFPDRTFLIGENEALTYREALLKVQKLTALLRRRGIRQGTHVAVCVSEGLVFTLISFSLFQIGAVKVPTSQKLSPFELHHVLAQSDTEYLIAQVRPDEDAIRELPALKEILTWVREENDPDGCSCLKDLCEKEADTDEIYAQLCGEEVADIMYTSGSTSLPKGVPLSHRNLLQSAYANDLNRGFEIGRRIYIPIPLNHIYGYVEGVLAGMLAGGTLCFTNGSFEAEKALRFIEKHAVNDILLVPSQAIKILRTGLLSKYKLNTLHAMYCAASTCPDTLWDEIKKGFGIDDVITGFGMTELAGAVMQTPACAPSYVLQRSVGRPLSYREMSANQSSQLELKIVSTENGKDLNKGEIGELVYRGPQLIGNYYKNPEADEKVYSPDGWFKSGDIGYFDQQGYFIFCGRCNEQYKINGENVSIPFVEKIIGECQQVVSVEIIDVPDQVTGAASMAFIEPKSFSETCYRDIKKYCQYHLAKFQIPKYYVFEKRSVLPQTATLKVQKYKLKELACKLIEESMAVAG